MAHPTQRLPGGPRPAHLRAVVQPFPAAFATVVATVVATVFAATFAVAFAQSASTDLRGDWTGAIDPDGVNLAIALHVEDAPDGLAIRLDVPPQGAFDLPVEIERREDDGSWVLLAPTLPAAPVFDGVVEGDRYEGTFTQGPASLPFRLARVDPADAESSATPSRPQVPQPPFPYDVIERTFDGAAARLAGTLVVPATGGPHPVVVLLNGSGAQDRDATVFGHPIMAVIADHLARAGIGSLRWDDRGVGGSEGDLGLAGIDGLVDDAAAAVRFLAEHREVDPDRIAVLGHSEGGLVALFTSLREVPVAALVTVAGPAVTGLELLIEQNRLILTQAAADEAAIDEQVAYLRALAAALEAGDDERARTLTRDRVEAQLDALPDGQAPVGEARAAYVDAQVANTASPTFEQLVLSHPQPALRRLDVPTLAVYFALDVQVAAAQNEGPMRDALHEAGVPHEVVTIEGVNHLMQPAETGGLEEYARIETTVAEEVLDLLAGWLSERFGLAE